MGETRLAKVYRSKAEWQEIMHRYRSSDLTQVAFCAREGLSLTGFHKWQAKLRAAVSPPDSFIELPGKVSELSWRLELEFADGLKLRLR